MIAIKKVSLSPCVFRILIIFLLLNVHFTFITQFIERTSLSMKLINFSVSSIFYLVQNVVCTMYMLQYSELFNDRHTHMSIDIYQKNKYTPSMWCSQYGLHGPKHDFDFLLNLLFSFNSFKRASSSSSSESTTTFFAHFQMLDVFQLYLNFITYF